MTTQSIEGAMPPLPEPVSHQFKSNDGFWHNFINAKHRWETVAAGYTIRGLYTEDQLQAYAAPLLARVAELEEALRLVLPMAKGYAHTYPVGSNQAYYDQADAALAAHKEQP